MLILLYFFRYRSPMTGKWVKARYRAELEVIRDSHAEFELIGEPEVRQVDQQLGWFDPAREEPDDREPA
jgi:hypothetical protein